MKRVVRVSRVKIHNELKSVRDFSSASFAFIHTHLQEDIFWRFFFLVLKSCICTVSLLFSCVWSSFFKRNITNNVLKWFWKGLLNVLLRFIQIITSEEFLEDSTLCGAQCIVWLLPIGRNFNHFTRHLAPGTSIQNLSENISSSVPWN